MPQKQNTILVNFGNGLKGKSVATGNNAAWRCICGSAEILIGRTGQLNSVSVKSLVVCPVCPREYRVVPEGKDRGRAERVDQIGTGADVEYRSGTLAFFPWLRLNEGIVLGEYELLPYKRGTEPGVDNISQRSMDRLLMPYHSGPHPVSTATILRVSDRDCFADFDDEEMSEAFVFSEVLAIGGLSERGFFGVGSLGY
jgi:hypothetical protein